MPSRILDFLDKIAKYLFIFSVVIFSFAAGFLVYHFKLPPYNLLFEANSAAKEISRKGVTSLTLDKEFKFGPLKQPVTILDKEKVWKGVTLYSDIKGKSQRKVHLINNYGKKLHTWHINYNDIWKDVKHFKRYSTPILHGIHLYPNGDLLANLSYGAIPYGNGIVKLDKDSKVLWTIDKNTHHDLTVSDKGQIYTVEHKLIRKEKFFCKGIQLSSDNAIPYYYEDFASIYDSNGKLVEKISVLKAICDSPYVASFYPPGSDANGASKLDGETINIIDSSEYIEAYDLLHVNAVRPISVLQAKDLPMANAGDILVSIRNLNTIGIIDRETKKLKWVMANIFQRQHDPDILKNGLIGVFDNRGNPEKNNLSRILIIDMVTQEIKWTYKSEPVDPFFTLRSGNKNHLENGNTLVVESERARIFEITPSNKIVWEFYNVYQKNKTQYFFRIQDAHKYNCSYVNFLENPCKM